MEDKAHVLDCNQIEWLPLCVGLAMLDLAGSRLAWRRGVT